MTRHGWSPSTIPEEQGALHGLTDRTQTLLQLLELVDERGPLIVSECQLREQLQRALIRETCAIQMASLLLPVPKSRSIQMPANHSQLRLEMLDAPEFFHAEYPQETTHTRRARTIRAGPDLRYLNES